MTRPESFTIHPFDLALDLERVAALFSLTERSPVTPEQVESWARHMPPGRVTCRLVAEDAAGQVVAYGGVTHETWQPPGAFNFMVIVDLPWRGRGLGGQLFEAALDFARANGAQRLVSGVKEEDATSLAFAQRRGFGVERHQYASTLDLARFDPSPYQGLVPALEAQGIRFFSLAEVGSTTQNQRKLHAVNMATALDIPGSSETWMSWEDFEQFVVGAPWFNPRGQIFAADGEAWIGLAAVQLIEADHSAYNLMTGVLPAYRGRKIATALKLLAIRYAQENGARILRTDNDSLNAPMLAINRKLGYVPEPGAFRLKREL